MKTCLSIIALCALELAACRRSDLQEFRSAEGGFTVRMPGVPNEQTRVANSPKGRIDIHVFVVENQKEGTYMIMYADYPEIIVKQKTPDAILDEARDGTVASAGGRLLAEEILSFGKWPGREMNVEIAGGRGKMRTRMCLAGRRIYQFGWTGPSERAFSKTVENFLDSFKLIEN